MTRLIDADALMDDIRKHSESYFADDFANIWVDKQPTVEAVPVSYIQKRIDRLRLLAEYEFEANGGYVGATHIAWHELEKILIEWEEERDANQDKTD